MSHTKEPMHAEIWLQCPNRDSMSEWYGGVTWAEDQINDDDTKYVRADLFDAATKQRDDLLAALDRIRSKSAALGIDAIFDEATEAIASVKGETPTTCKKCNTPDLCMEYGRACDQYPGEEADTSAPSIVFYPAGSLGEAVDSEGGAA